MKCVNFSTHPSVVILPTPPIDNKFTGHERDNEANLTLDCMMVRNYDPELGRFLQVDPLANEFPGWTPYHYVHNNPVGLTDPTGMATCDVMCMGGLLAAQPYTHSDGVDVHNDLFGLEEVNCHLLPEGCNYREKREKLLSGELTKEDNAANALMEGEAVLTALMLVGPLPKFGLLSKVKSFIGWNRTAKGSSKILYRTTKQLQKKYKDHGSDFGLTGNWNKATAGKFSSAINQHINSPSVKIIQGTYRKKPAIHYLNLNTGLNVISRPNG